MYIIIIIIIIMLLLLLLLYVLFDVLLRNKVHIWSSYINYLRRWQFNGDRNMPVCTHQVDSGQTWSPPQVSRISGMVQLDLGSTLITQLSLLTTTLKVLRIIQPGHVQTKIGTNRCPDTRKKYETNKKCGRRVRPTRYALILL